MLWCKCTVISGNHKVGDEGLKTESLKACSVVLDDGLDLEQIDEYSGLE